LRLRPKEGKPKGQGGEHEAQVVPGGGEQRVEGRHRERVPLDWAMTQSNLGNAFAELGARESGTAHLAEAVAAYRAALEELTRDRGPLQWATVQAGLGIALASVGVREGNVAILEEAVKAYDAALEERRRDLVPLLWAMTTGNQGIALTLLADKLSDPAKAQVAVQQIEAAITTMRDHGNTDAAYYETELPKAQAVLQTIKDRKPN
jgi:hypothetical protein